MGAGKGVTGNYGREPMREKERKVQECLIQLHLLQDWETKPDSMANVLDPR